MILKEKQITNPTDPRLKAGEDAEKQMAFYLSRAFTKEKYCYVISDIRIVHNQNTAQIDHLIVTQYGLFIIESKSGAVSVNKHNEWTRTYNNKAEGMASPVLQGQRQGEVLKELISENREKLLGKMLLGKIQKGFKYCPVFVYVAISDKGLPPDRGIDIPELLKADLVAQAITSKLKQLKQKNSLLSLSLNLDVAWDMSAKEAEIVAKFLLNQNKSLIKKSPSLEKKSTTLTQTNTVNPQEKNFAPKVGAVCPQCKNHQLIRKSINRRDGTETDFLACEGYPSKCKAIYALVAVAQTINATETERKGTKYKENDDCPNCKTGNLVQRKAKTEFLGCSNYPKCRFTDYKEL